MRVRMGVAGLLVLLGAGAASGQAVSYGEEGLEIRSEGDGFKAVVGFRNQLRFTTPFVDVPVDAADIDRTDRDDFRLNRSRFRLNGHVFSEKLEYQFQWDFVEERARDLSVTVNIAPWLRVRGGRWKVEYNRERITSSGAQQLVDRSILDGWFTLGRQQGLEVFGRVGDQRMWGGDYFVGAFRSVEVSDVDGLPVWLGRYQWTYAGREVELEQGDLDVSRDLRLAVGTSLVRIDSFYAQFSGAGIGEPLPDLPQVPGDRYRTRQYAGDVTMKWRGVSVQGEAHHKAIRGTASGLRRELRGAFVQAGVLASTLWGRAPRQLEFAGRVALVDPDRARPDNWQGEYIAGANWYFDKHRNKVSVDVSRLQYATPEDTRTTDIRTRVQWEVTF